MTHCGYNALQVKRDKLLRPAGTELTAYGFGILLDFWVSELREALKKEGVIAATAAETKTSSSSSSSVDAATVPLPDKDDIDQGAELCDFANASLTLTLRYL